jgi:hypothetical protein
MGSIGLERLMMTFQGALEGRRRRCPRGRARPASEFLSRALRAGGIFFWRLGEKAERFVCPQK